MKKLFLILILTAGITASAQGPLSQFTRVTRGAKVSLMRDANQRVLDWYVKPAAQFAGYNLQWNPETKFFDSKQFSGYGVGIQLQHYAVRNDQLIPDYGINGMMILNVITPDSPGLGIAAGVTALGFVNITVGRDFTNKVWLFMPGAVWTF